MLKITVKLISYILITLIRIRNNIVSRISVSGLERWLTFLMKPELDFQYPHWQLTMPTPPARG